MSSDYLKQLQLTKQLEQKAKQLAKERKDAEASLATVQEAIRAAREFDLDVSEVEAALAAASEAFSNREHVAAHSQAKDGLEKLRVLERTRLAAVADGIRAALEAIGGSGELEERLERATLMSERPNEALKLAYAIRFDVDRETGERLKARTQRARELLSYADSIELAVDVAAGDIDAILAKTDGEPEAAWKEFEQLMERLLAPFRARFDEKSSEIVGQATKASLAEVELTPLTELIGEGREALDVLDAERAFDLVDQAEKSRSKVLNEAIERRVAVLKEESLEIEEAGGELSSFQVELRKSQKTKGEGALEPLRRATEALQEARARVLMDAMHSLRPRLQLSLRLDLDISPASELLDEARDLLAGRKLSDALERTELARDALDRGLSGHLGLASELDRTMGLFLTMRKLRLAQSEASELVAGARRLALDGRLEESRSLLADAAQKASELMFDAGARRALSGISNLSQAIAVGAEVDDERARLLSAMDRVQDGQYDALIEMDETAGLLRRASFEAASALVADASNRIASTPMVDLSDLGADIDNARRLLEGNEPLNAASMARDVEAKAIGRQRGASLAMARKASELLTLSKALGCSSETIECTLDLGRRSTDPADSVKLYAEAADRATRLIKEELSAQLPRLSRDIAAARRNGVRVDRAAKLSDQALRKLADDVMGSHRAMDEAVAELGRSIAAHRDIYDRIAFLAKAVGRSGLPPKNPAQSKLDETKRLFEAGKYDGARVSAKACLEELESLAAATLISEHMEDTQDTVALLQDLLLDMPEIQSLMEKAEDALRNERHGEALSHLREVDQAASDAIRRGLRELIDETSAHLAQCSRLGCDVESARNILNRAASLLSDSRYQDALRAVRFAGNEGRRLLSLFHSVESGLEWAEMCLEEAEGRGPPLKDAHALLQKAYEEMRGGKQSLALERGRMAHELVHNAVTAQLKDYLDEIESWYVLADLNGHDLASWAIDRGVVSDALQRSPRWAFYAADRYDEVLMEVNEMRVRALSALESIPASVSAHDERVALEAFERGSFSHCIAVLAPAMAEEPIRDSLENRRRDVLDRLREKVSETPGADVDHLLDAMGSAHPKRFWELHSEVLEALAIRRRTMRRERIGRLIDPLRAITLLGRESASKRTERLLSTPLTGLSDDDLQLIDEIGKEARDAVADAIERVRSRDDAGDATMDALVEAEVLLRNGSFTLSARTVREADLARGWTAEERRGLWSEYAELMRRMTVLEGRGGEVQEAKEAMSIALVSAPGPSREAMADAWTLIKEEERVLLPAIRMEVLKMSPPTEGWGRMSVALVNEGGTAIGLRAEGDVKGILPDALPPGRRHAEIEVRDDSTIQLFYRPLFSAKEDPSPALM